MNLINWLNQNQGFMMAILTLVYVLTTIGIALLTLRVTSLSKKNIETAIDLENRRIRPYVIFHISSFTTRRATFASLKNFGLTADEISNINIKMKNVTKWERKGWTK